MKLAYPDWLKQTAIAESGGYGGDLCPSGYDFKVFSLTAVGTTIFSELKLNFQSVLRHAPKPLVVLNPGAVTIGWCGVGLTSFGSAWRFKGNSH